MEPSKQGQSASLLQCSTSCMALVAEVHADGPKFVTCHLCMHEKGDWKWN